MLFRNLSLFRFSPAVAATLGELETALDAHRLRPCGPLELATHGFVSPLGRPQDALTRTLQNCVLFSAGNEDKLLPAAVINAELGRRIQARAEELGRPVGGRERKRMKQELFDELLPRAFARPSRLPGYLDLTQGWAVLDTASRKAAEAAISGLREALGSFPALPLAAERAPRLVMTEWLTARRLPEGLELGDECELREATGNAGAIARCRRQALDADEVQEHLRAGKQVAQLGLVFDGRIAFVLSEDLVLRKLKFLDVIQEELNQQPLDSAEAELDARFTLMALELRRLFDKLHTWFGLPRPQDA
ncbi:recombination-associated protein RdgC [Metallibacterium sp.]|uniref:recombination-associated protein RdgC n=1 Tax=Metallibacterium sp. TaxID=2940281 RepID=UPI002638F980|nr:recombination-associated protein RdgC [Metallibacterium sp.]